MQTFQGIRVAAMSFPPGLCSREDPLRCSSGGFSFLPAFIDHVVSSAKRGKSPLAQATVRNTHPQGSLERPLSGGRT
jgi:hypothetical protein